MWGVARFLDCRGGDEGHVNSFLKTSFSTSHVEWQLDVNTQEELQPHILILCHTSVYLNYVQKVKVNE